MRIKITIVFFGILNYGFGQNCFSDIWNSVAKFESQGLAFPETNQKAIDQLVGCKIPDFKVKSLDGKSFELGNLKGKILVINFWFTNCPPCISEMPGLNKLADEYNNQDVIFIAFGRDDEVVLKKFLNNRRFNFIQIPNSSTIAETFAVIAGWPMSFVVDSQGVVVKVKSGGFQDQRAESEIYDALKPSIEQCLNREKK